MDIRREREASLKVHEVLEAQEEKETKERKVSLKQSSLEREERRLQDFTAKRAKLQSETPWQRQARRLVRKWGMGRGGSFLAKVEL